jgi:predicted tellurium resistance membrane protein TerC
LAECGARVEPLSLYSRRRIAFLRAMFDWLSNPDAWLSLVTLTVLEIVLGVDNIIFISILSGKLPAEQQGKARNIGLLLALVTRIALLSFIFLLTKLIHPLFSLLGHGFSGKDLVMLFGGFFLIWKSIKEIHHSLEGAEQEKSSSVAPKLANIIVTIVFVDILFSLDSVITAVGLVGGATHSEPAHIVTARHALESLVTALGTVPPAAAEALAQAKAALAPATAPAHGGGNMTIMVLAIIISMMVMLAAAKTISDFVNRHPTIKMLALSFLILVGFVLMADGFGHEVPKGYIYAAMAFSFLVEMLNINVRRKSTSVPVDLRSEY